MGRRSLTRLPTISLILIIVMLTPLPLTVYSQQNMDKPTLDWSLTNNTLTVTTDNYRVVLDGDKGGITIFSIRLGQIEYNLLQDGDIIPIPVLELVSGEPSTGFTRTRGNETYTLDYPGSLSLMPWTVEVMNESDTMLVVKLTPSEQALQDLEPLKAYAIVTFYSWTPLVGYKLVLVNNGDTGYTLEGRGGGAAIGILVNDQSDTWKYGVEYNGTVREYDTLDLEWDNNIDGVFLFKRVQGRLAYMATLIPEIEPVKVVGTKGLKSGNYTSNTTYTLLFDLGTVNVPPKGETVVKFKISYLPAKPLQLAQVGLLDAAVQLDEGMLQLVKQGFTYLEEIQNLNSTINSLRERVKNLQEELRKKDEKLAECQGCEDHWKTELSAAQEKIKVLQDRLEKAGMVQVAAFIVGLLLGFIGVRYAFR